MNWTQRILDFPVRAAAVDDFLQDLRARGTGDLNAVMTTLNEGGLCRQALRHWTENGWIVLAPSTPTLALTGPAFVRNLTLRNFCGEPEDAGAEIEIEPEAPARKEEDSKSDGDS
jgi:hypothetical protein